MTIKNTPTAEHIEILESFRKHFVAYFEQGYWSRSIAHDRMVMLNNMYKYITGDDKDVNMNCQDCVHNMLSFLYKQVLLPYHPDKDQDSKKTYGVTQDWEIKEIKDTKKAAKEMRFTGNSLECRQWITANRQAEPIKMDLSRWHHTWKKWLQEADRVDLEKVCVALGTHSQKQLENIHPLDMKAAIKAELIKRGELLDAEGEKEEAPQEPVEKKELAHDAETGHFVADDPKTPGVNEHYKQPGAEGEKLEEINALENMSREDMLTKHEELFKKKAAANITDKTLRKKLMDKLTAENDG